MARTISRILPMLLGLAAGAAAAESHTLHFADGKKKTMSVESCDAGGVTVREGGGVSRIEWHALAPGSAYAVRKSFTSFDDGPARLALAEFAAALRLYPEAQEQLEIALALDGLDEAAFEQRSETLAAEEVAWLKERIDALLATRAHPTECLGAIKRLKERYPDDSNNSLYEPRVQELVEAIAKEMQGKQDLADESGKDAAAEKLRGEVEKLQKKKAEALARADALMTESAEAVEKRVISRIKKCLVEPQGAEKYLKRARTFLRAIATADPRFTVVSREDLQAEYDATEKKLVECYLGVARQLMRDRNYKSAVDSVRKILYYDPIHEEALEMKAEIEKNRIHFKASDITNARPRVTGG